MRTIAIINQKGGCGKTTTSINLAACLARLGQKTLLVDMDPQGHCGTGLAVPEEQIEKTILESLLEPGDAKDGKSAPIRLSEVVWQIATDFDLAPSNIRLSAFEQLFAGRAGRDDRLTRALDTVRDAYQWCIVDCPPSVGLITFNALKAADEVVVPVETGYFSLHGLGKMMETLELMRDRCGKEVHIRVLPTLYDTRTKLAREVLSELRAKFRDILMDSTVNFNTKLKEAASFGQPITEYDPGSRGYKDFVNLARELMGRRPVEAPADTGERLSRPAELVQRAKQLAHMTNIQFGRHAVPTFAPAMASGMPSAMPGAMPSALPAAGAPRMPAGMPQPMPSAFPSAGPAGRMVPGASPAAVAAAAARQGHAGPSFGNGLTTSPSLSGGTLAGYGVAQPAHAAPAFKTTGEKLDEFYGVHQFGEEVVFACKFARANQVLIAGDFNNWQPIATPMQPNRPGEWTMRLPLRPGRYRYRFVVDGKWVTDPHNNYVEANQYGELNNVVEVE